MIGFIVIAVVVTLLIIYISKKDKTNDSVDSLIEDKLQNDFETEEIIHDDFSDRFFERTEEGEMHQLFLTIGAQQDVVNIRSLLASYDIPSYAKDENINRMYGGFCPTGMFCQKVYILINDYEEAFEIVSEYLNNKKENPSDNPTETKVSVVMAAALNYPIVNDVTLKNVIVHPKAAENEKSL